MSMRIGITMRIIQNYSYPEQRDALSKDWSDFFSRILPKATLIPLLNQPDHIIEVVEGLSIDAVVLSNGNDWGSAPDRDQTEQCLVEHCFKREIPLLGICRGFHVLNILFGGQLENDIRRQSGEKHVKVDHILSLQHEPFTEWAQGEQIITNSYHNQGITINMASQNFKVFALTSSGVVEGFFYPGKPVIGIQWHPERKNPAESFDRELIETLFCTNTFSNTKQGKQE